MDRPSPTLARPTQGSGLGVAIGPAVVLHAKIDTSGYQPGDPDKERKRLDKATAKAAKQLRKLAAKPIRANAAIFGAQGDMLVDERLTGPAYAKVDAGTPAPVAWSESMAEHRVWLRGLPDAHGQLELAASVEHRVLALLTGAATDFELEGPGILVVDTLDPGAAAGLDAELVLGVVTKAGGNTGHGVIVARSRGIPTFSTAGAALDGIADGTTIAFVATGDRRLVTDPSPEELQWFVELRDERARNRAEALAHAHEPVVTTDGAHLEVFANILAEDSADEATTYGPDGWVARTEILFGQRETAPTAEEQADAFRRLGRTFGGKRMIVRTWDVGGDKTVPFMPLDPEENPFLGVRGIRVFRNRPEMLTDQIEAVCVAGRETPLSLMFPMVTTVEELDWALGLLDEVTERVGRPDSLKVGMMMEVPAAALRTRLMTERLDFVSIGTNDLTQYTTAAERGNAALHLLADPLDPAVLRLIKLVCDEASENTAVGVCGDAATDPDVACLLLGLGVRELTPAPPMVPTVKARLRQASVAQLSELAERALACRGAAEVRALIQSNQH